MKYSSYTKCNDLIFWDRAWKKTHKTTTGSMRMHLREHFRAKQRAENPKSRERRAGFGGTFVG